MVGNCECSESWSWLNGSCGFECSKSGLVVGVVWLKIGVG